MIAQKHSLEIEQRVLENLMSIADSNDSRLQNAFLKLSSDCFYNQANAQLFLLAKQCFDAKEMCGFVDVLVKIKHSDSFLHDSLTWIIDNHKQFHINESTLESDIDKLIAYKNLRKQITITNLALQEIKDCSDVNQCQNILNEKISEIANLNYQESKAGITNAELAELFYEGKLEDDLVIPTTCESLNSALNGGIRTKSLITVAAGAGVGKTGFSIFLLESIARNQRYKQNLFFSLEMEAKHIWMRHVGICAGKQFEQLSKNERLNGVAKSLEIPLTVYDVASNRACSNIDFILTTARMRASKAPICVIVVDYLGLVENHGNFERNDLKQSDITSKLAKLALELNCVVIALSQINRSAATRGKDDQCPYPSDAADSSGSHRSSTLWLGVDRPELYQDDPIYKNQFVVKCRKNRFGGTFEIVLAFNDGTFSEVQPGYFKKPFAKTKKNHEELIFCSFND